MSTGEREGKEGKEDKAKGKKREKEKRKMEGRENERKEKPATLRIREISAPKTKNQKSNLD